MLNQESEKRIKIASKLGPVIGETSSTIAKVVLFGSSYKGTATPDSDIDIAWIYDRTPKSFKFEDVMKEAEERVRRQGFKLGQGPCEVQLLGFFDGTIKDPIFWRYHPLGVAMDVSTGLVVYRRSSIIELMKENFFNRLGNTF